MEIADLIAKYDRRVPRYTSYPTAPHFNADVTPATYGAWLRALPADTSLSLYLHVPFCQSLCRFCACHTTVARKTEPLLAYAETLVQEIDLVADTIGRNLAVRHIHWGGGTPTILPHEAFRRIMTRLGDRFAIARDAEIAVEIDPRTLTAPMVETLAAVGTNRASLGVQDFNPVVQEAIGRMQSFDLTASCVESLRRVGIGGINLDLIYGLPFQTVEGVAHTVSQAMSLDPDRAAVFGYAHVPWMKKHQSRMPEDALPGAVERYRQREAVEHTITDLGYIATGLDHFARPTDAMAQAAAALCLRRNFQGYTTDTAPVLIGLGASSIGSLPDGYVQNHPQVPAWRDAIRANTLAAARGIALTPDDRLRRAVIESIMCHFGVDLREVAARFDADPATLMDAAPALQDLARDGLAHWDGFTVTVTQAGRPFLRAVAAAFDTRLRSGEARHSAAV
ncbi:MAG: oxygen-independent coproporphyrinogen III oxidase [Acetobacteraceae bacterium]